MNISIKGDDAPFAIQTGPLMVNTYIIPLAGDEVLIVDPAACALTRDEDAIANCIKAHGKRPAGIFLTHGHFDHILGIPALVNAFDGIDIAISAKDEAAITDDSLAFHRETLCMMNDDGIIASALKDVVNAARGHIKTFCDGDVLSDVFASAIGGDSGKSKEDKNGKGNEGNESASSLAHWRVIASAGHTAGSVCLYNDAGDGKAGYLLSGDTVFFRGYGRTDMGGSESAIMKSLKMLKKAIPPQTLVFPGHDRGGFEFASWSQFGY